LYNITAGPELPCVWWCWHCEDKSCRCTLYIQPFFNDVCRDIGSLPRDATQSAVIRLHVVCPSVTIRYR